VRSKQELRWRKRAKKRRVPLARDAELVEGHASSGPCPDAGSEMGETCPRCGKPEVKAHACRCCIAFLGCCACGYALSEEETKRIVRACDERDSTSTLR
jgi:hypothetical protein